jgi:hypothetical protein
MENIKKSYSVQNGVSGHVFGIYEAMSPEEAISLMMKEGDSDEKANDALIAIEEEEEVEYKTLDQLDEGDMVNDGYGSIAVVKKCVHGHLYYANYGTCDEDDKSFILVSDIDHDYISACCG